MVPKDSAQQLGNILKNEILYADLNPDRVQISDDEFESLGQLAHSLSLSRDDLKTIAGQAETQICIDANGAAGGCPDFKEYVRQFFANCPKITYDRLEKEMRDYVNPSPVYFCPVESQAP